MLGLSPRPPSGKRPTAARHFSRNDTLLAFSNAIAVLVDVPALARRLRKGLSNALKQSLLPARFYQIAQCSGFGYPLSYVLLATTRHKNSRRTARFGNQVGLQVGTAQARQMNV